MSRRALLLGASGETGKEVLKNLVDNAAISKVIVVGRRNIEVQNGAKVEQRIVDFDNLDAASFRDVDMAFCCLGTTRAKAGKEGFIKVDHDYVLNSARLLKSGGCEEFHLLTSLGANANSLFLYPQTKGRVEEDVKQLAFRRLTIYRPGMLLCDRGSESRFAEKLFGGVFNAFNRAISTELLAKVMVATSLKKDDESAKNVTTLEQADIMKIAKDL